ncbi:MAG: DoxX family protein [Chloroflexota bacterium]
MERLTIGERRAVAILRVAVGSIFLFAGLDKWVGINSGGNPFSAAGFLKAGTNGTWPGVAAAPAGSAPVVVNPTHDFWVGLAANADLMAFLNFLVVFGQIAIGIALIVGIATRFSAIMGALMMVLFGIAAWDFGHGIVNQHFAYALITLFLGYIGAGRAYGLDEVIEKEAAVKHNPQLRYVPG